MLALPLLWILYWLERIGVKRATPLFERVDRWACAYNWN
jgi:hypothetical protein